MQVKHTHLCGFKATNDTFISRAKLFRKVGFGSIITFSLLILAILSPIYIKFSGVEAVSGTANPSTTTLSLNVVDNLLSLDLSPTSSYGTFASSSPASIQVSTNNVSGYTLSIKSNVVDTSDSNAVSNATNLVNTVDSTKVISSISTATSSSAFSTNTNTQYNNKWGYLPSKLNSLTNTNYLPSPSYNEATILNTTTCANGITSASCTTSATDTYTITLGARVDSTLPTGSYEHDFVLIAVGNPINYSITYHANDGADGANTTNMPTPNPQTGNADTSTTSVVLSTTKPRRQGYELKGWCSVVPTADSTYPDDQNCTGEGAVLYQPGADYGIDQTTTNIVDLYATWWQPNLLKLNEAHATMQQMSPMACYNSVAYSKNNADANHTPYDASTNPNGYHSATLTDNRDGTTRNYNIVKMPDGLCWMTDNLNLGADSEITLTSANTDLADGTTFTLPASDATTFSTSTAQANLNTATILHDITIPDYTVNSQTYSGKKASYYSYAAATADISTYSKTSGAIVTTSICPKGWDLPTDYQYMNLRNIGGYNIDQYHYANASYANYGRNAGDTPYSFTYGGYQKAAIPAGTTLTSSNLNTYFNYGTSYGYYWTARNYNNSYGYSTYVYSNGLYNSTGSYQYKYYKEMIRCVAGNGTATINYDGNGTTEYPVTGTTTSQVDVEINSTMTKANGFTRTGWAFNGWNTKADGSGIAIAANVASTTPLSNLGLADGDTITLYAQWNPLYTITYNSNYSGGPAAKTQTIILTNNPSTGTETGTLAAYNQFTRTGYKIKSWNTDSTGSGTDYLVSTTYTVPAGSGPGDGITLYAQWVPVFSLIYNGNGADSTATDGTMTNIKHTNVAEGDYVDLFASNYKRTGYGFAGWSLTQVSTTSASDINSAVAAGTLKIYGPNETFHPDSTFSTYADSNKNVTLYAVWVAPETDGSSNPLYFQDFDFTNTTYSSMPNGSIIALTDNRDNDVYLVAKLADGNWWMAENLRLDDSATLTTANTNNPLNDGANVTLTQAWWSTSSVTLGSSTTANHLSPSLLNKLTGNTYASWTTWCMATYGANVPKCYDQSMLNTWNKLHITNTATSGYTYTYSPSAFNYVTTATQTSPSHTNLDNSIYSYGNYYNWYSATAGNGTSSKSSGNVAGDLCPTGWHLPYGNNGTGTGGGKTSGGFAYLDTLLESPDGSHGTGAIQSTSIASQRWRVYPNNFIYSGYYGSSAYERGSRGGYWSSSAYYNNGAYVLYFNSSNVTPGSGSVYKYYGFSVRCVTDDSYTIVYDGNGATAGSMTANGVEIKYAGVHEGDTIDLYAPNYKKDGYGFVGWSPSPTATVGGSAPIYGPNETIAAPSYETYKSAPRRVTLYAIWMAKDATNTMQTFNSSNRCNSMPQATYNNGTITVPSGSIIALEDERDGNVYTIAKLADGNCWMTENLRLDNTATITTANTNNPLNDGTNVILKNDYANNLISNKLSATSDTWCGNSDAACEDQTILNTNNTNLGGKNASGADLISTPGYPINSDTSGQNGSTFSWYSYGNYYNWYSATAGNGTYSKSSGNVDGDLCPTGWHLPYGGSGTSGTNIGGTSGGFSYLDKQMDGTGSTQSTSVASNKWRMFPNNFIYSGFWNGSSASNRGYYGYYWSSLAYNNYGAYYLNFRSSSVDPGEYSHNKYNGFTVRCVAGGSGS